MWHLVDTFLVLLAFRGCCAVHQRRATRLCSACSAPLEVRPCDRCNTVADSMKLDCGMLQLGLWVDLAYQGPPSIQQRSCTYDDMDDCASSRRMQPPISQIRRPVCCPDDFRRRPKTPQPPCSSLGEPVRCGARLQYGCGARRSSCIHSASGAFSSLRA